MTYRLPLAAKAIHRMNPRPPSFHPTSAVSRSAIPRAASAGELEVHAPALVEVLGVHAPALARGCRQLDIGGELVQRGLLAPA